MNSRERVLAVASREPVDRPATSLRCTPEAWVKLRDYLGVESNEDALDALDIDLRWVPLPFNGPQDRSAIPLGSEGTDFWGCHIHKVENEFNSYFEFDHYPLAEAQTVEDIHNHSWPELDWWDYDAINEQIAIINRKEPRALLFFSGGTFETPWYLRGMERFMMDLYDNPDIVNAICTHVGDYYYDRALRVIETADGQIDIIGSGGDIGSQKGLMVAPEVWRERIKPHCAKLISNFKNMGLTTFYHSCGSIVPIIDDLIEVGLDILEPIQVTAAGMLPEELAPKFATRISFHGAIDEVNLLPNASASEVYEETTRIINILGKNYGFIVSPSHQVQGDTPPENVVALFEAARNYKF